MKKFLFLLALAVFAALAFFLLNTPYQAFKISSKILGEKRTILEFLPDSYQSSGQSYPILLHLDAYPRISTYGPSFYSVAESLNSSEHPIPEMIVLGVMNTNRNRDMIPVSDTTPAAAGGAWSFLRFITEELIPEAQSRYRTTDHRILYGRSDSGLFSLYALTEDPAAFQTVIASSPSIGHCPDFMTDRVRRLFKEHPGLSNNLFIVYGSDEGRLVLDHVLDFIKAIRSAAPENFNFGVKVIPGGGHIPRSSLEDGLRFGFSKSGIKQRPVFLKGR